MVGNVLEFVELGTTLSESWEILEFAGIFCGTSDWCMLDVELATALLLLVCVVA